MKGEVHEVKTKWNDAVMKCMMMKFDNNAVKHRDIMTQRQNTNARLKMQCNMQDTVLAMNTNNEKCQHHQRCYAAKTTVKVCEA